MNKQRRDREISDLLHITCCILHVIQSRARWYATVPLREKRRSHYWADHLPGRLCVRSASLRQLIIKLTKQAGLSCTRYQFSLQMRLNAQDRTGLSFIQGGPQRSYRSFKKDEDGATMNRTLCEEKIRSFPESRYQHGRLSALQENPFKFQGSRAQTFLLITAAISNVSPCFSLDLAPKSSALLPKLNRGNGEIGRAHV